MCQIIVSLPSFVMMMEVIDSSKRRYISVRLYVLTAQKIKILKIFRYVCTSIVVFFCSVLFCFVFF